MRRRGRTLAETLADYRTEAAMLPAYDPRMAWLLGAIRATEDEIAAQEAAA
jgi:hypothetical protein